MDIIQITAHDLGADGTRASVPCDERGKEKLINVIGCAHKLDGKEPAKIPAIAAVLRGAFFFTQSPEHFRCRAVYHVAESLLEKVVWFALAAVRGVQIAFDCNILRGGAFYFLGATSPHGDAVFFV
jgi:hypothetical protein